MSTSQHHHRTRALVAFATIAAFGASSAVVQPRSASALDPLPPPAAAGFHDGVYVPIDDVLIAEQGNATVVANGNLALTWAGSNLPGRPTPTTNSTRSTPMSDCAAQ